MGQLESLRELNTAKPNKKKKRKKEKYAIVVHSDRTSSES
jgi:hypothetical protein